MRKRTQEEFIVLAKSVHKGKYDYSKVKYVNNTTKVCIICPEHSEFWQSPKEHIKGSGCPACGRIKQILKQTLTFDEFIKRSKEKHGDKYDYSKVKYVNSSTKVCIICPEHGEFLQTPDHHMNGHECKACSMKAVIKANSLTQEDFITRSNKQHNNKYDYSKVKYVNSSTKVCIICPEHGEFCQAPYNHLQGQGCPECGRLKNTSTTDDFISKAKKIHGDKYDYSKVNYLNSYTPVCIICLEHGEFMQTPHLHLRCAGCPQCGQNSRIEKIALTTSDFIEKAKAIHGDKYDYSKVRYEHNQKKVCIICSKHGEFWQAPGNHLYGYGCQQCGYERRIENQTYTFNEILDKFYQVHGTKYDYSDSVFNGYKEHINIRCPKHGEFYPTVKNHIKGTGCPKCADEEYGRLHSRTRSEFISIANKVHDNSYDYSQITQEYVTNDTIIDIKCPKHGIFQQNARSHLRGSGCSKCNASRLEQTTIKHLNNLSIYYIHDKPYKPWHNKLRPDFYIPILNLMIECQGDDHFKPFSRSKKHSETYILKRFQDLQHRDDLKRHLCKQHNIELIYFTTPEYFDTCQSMGIKTFDNVSELINYIQYKIEHNKDNTCITP